MDISWLSSIFYGFISGLSDILPVSAQAHRVLMLKFLGIRGNLHLQDLLIHLAVAAALYNGCRSHLIRMRRARALARIPKKKRKRPLDVRSLMDWSMVKTMCVPAILGLCLYQYAQPLEKNLVAVAAFLFVNGMILYIPQFFPTGNKDSRTLSRVEGLLMGLGGMASVLPGISAIGAATSLGSVCGIDRAFNLTIAMIMNLVLVLGMAVYDVLGIVRDGMEVLSFVIIVKYLLTAAAAFGGTMLGVKFLRRFTEEHSYALFGMYCWGMALFTFILNLMA